jgi:hypothetical protein
MNLKNMSYGTLLGLITVCIIDSIENKLNNLFVKKPKKTYRYFSGYIVGTFSNLFSQNQHQQIESISNNIRYDSTADTWEVFKRFHYDVDVKDIEFHNGLRGHWEIVDNEQKIRDFRRMFLEENSGKPPMIQI